MQRARIKLWGRDPRKLDEIAREIKELANKLGVAVRGPIPLPTKRLRITCIRTPCGDGMHRGGPTNWDHWELRIHKRIIDVAANPRILRQITRIPIPQDVKIEIELTD